MQKQKGFNSVLVFFSIHDLCKVVAVEIRGSLVGGKDSEYFIKISIDLGPRMSTKDTKNFLNCKQKELNSE